ncbi:MAG: cytochrome c [Bacteroidales bacterium]|jgi:mono/diheme cytochrome c family protein
MKNSEIFRKALIIFTAGMLVFTLNVGAQQKPWSVPEQFISMKNPVAKDNTGKKAGMALYVKNCASCHGREGLGDGVKARTLKDFPGDFSSGAYQGQTDGEQFYKTKSGRGEMPKYEGKLTDEEIWYIVNYMRSFKK